MWTITSLYKDSSNPQALPTLPYLNNPLDECKISQLRMEYDSTNDLDVSILQYSEWGVEVRAFATCSVSGPSGNIFINATAVYNALTPYPMPGVTDFIAHDANSKSSMYWSEVLLRAYWLNATSTVSAVSNVMAQNQNGALSKGVVTLYPNKNQQNITSLHFFDMQYDFLEQRSGFGFTGSLNSMANYVGNTSTSANPHIWSSVDKFAKSMYSAAMVDLGQTQLPTESSLVTEKSVIQSFTSTFADPFEWSLTTPIPPMLIRESYDTRQSGPDPTGTLGISPSVVATKYLCQVPRLKPKGDIFVAVLLADLVFLQLAWKTYTFLVDKYLVQKQPRAMFCEGCEDPTLGAVSLYNPQASFNAKRALHTSVHSTAETNGKDTLSLRSRLS